MPHIGSCSPAEPESRPRFEVAQVFRDHGEVYRRTHVVSERERKAMWAIEACRTSVLGGHVDVCSACDYQAISYNSCRNRHCPKCQSLSQARWIEQRKLRILATSYFHVVFTLPHELNPLARANPRLIYDLLFVAASRTLLEFGRNPDRLGAELGITCVLHTWTRDLRLHPHVHCLVTSGGLAGSRWVDKGKGKYLFPVRALSALFRGKFLAALDRAYAQGELDLEHSLTPLADPNAFAKLKDSLYRKDWVVYAKRPFGGPEQVFRYLGRYTHRVGISNHRILAITASQISFATKNGKRATLTHEEFIRRFLLHILPDRFVKIRHYGLLAPSNVNTKLVLANQALSPGSPPTTPSVPLPSSWRDLLATLTGIDLTQCPRCSHGTLVRYPLVQIVHLPERTRTIDTS